MRKQPSTYYPIPSSTSKNPQKNPLSHYYSAQETSELFLNVKAESEASFDFQDMFSIKAELAKDRINLILGEIRMRERIAKLNLASLYDDLMQIDIWRRERGFPARYTKDKIWTDHNKMELQVRDKIRTELKDFARDCSLTFKDLRESLLEHKLESKKLQMLDFKDLEDMIDKSESKYLTE